MRSLHWPKTSSHPAPGLQEEGGYHLAVRGNLWLLFQDKRAGRSPLACAQAPHHSSGAAPRPRAVPCCTRTNRCGRLLSYHASGYGLKQYACQGCQSMGEPIRAGSPCRPCGPRHSPVDQRGQDQSGPTRSMFGRHITRQRHFHVLTKFAHVESRLSGHKRQREMLFLSSCKPLR